MKQRHPSEDDAILAPMSDEDAARLRAIRSGLRDLSRAYRARHPWLDAHQSAIGLASLLGALAMMIAAAAAYGYGWLPAWATVVLIAFACSIAHEVEHDTIHRLYYPRLPQRRDARARLADATEHGQPLLPNLLRTFCLHFISSNIHYHGDVAEGDVLRQTQVIDRWYIARAPRTRCSESTAFASTISRLSRAPTGIAASGPRAGPPGVHP